jgi:hypothetical protein
MRGNFLVPYVLFVTGILTIGLYFALTADVANVEQLSTYDYEDLTSGE